MHCSTALDATPCCDSCSDLCLHEHIPPLPLFVQKQGKINPITKLIIKKSPRHKRCMIPSKPHSPERNRSASPKDTHLFLTSPERKKPREDATERKHIPSTPKGPSEGLSIKVTKCSLLRNWWTSHVWIRPTPPSGPLCQFNQGSCCKKGLLQVSAVIFIIASYVSNMSLMMANVNSTMKPNPRHCVECCLFIIVLHVM